MPSTFEGTRAYIAIAICAINSILVLAFLTHIWLQGWVTKRTD
ncbi:MAG: hypothetical protein WAM30_07645 [Candidatus Dormiibacterota bacterium]